MFNHSTFVIDILYFTSWNYSFELNTKFIGSLLVGISILECITNPNVLIMYTPMYQYLVGSVLHTSTHIKENWEPDNSAANVHRINYQLLYLWWSVLFLTWFCVEVKHVSEIFITNIFYITLLADPHKV